VVAELPGGGIEIAEEQWQLSRVRALVRGVVHNREPVQIGV
jgi:hypothetical protein